MWRDVYNSQHEMRIHVKQHISPHSPQYRPQDILRPALKFWISLSVFVRYFMPLKLFRVSLSQTWRHHLAKNIQLYSSFSNYCPGHRHPRGPSLHSTPSRQKKPAEKSPTLARSASCYNDCSNFAKIFDRQTSRQMAYTLWQKSQTQNLDHFLCTTR